MKRPTQATSGTPWTLREDTELGGIFIESAQDTTLIWLSWDEETRRLLNFIVDRVNAYDDLLYACQESLAYLNQHQRGDDLRVATILQNVIAKAKGEQP